VGDLLAGVSVALVLIPQSLAYAELAGMPPERGLYASAIPLLVAAPLVSCPYLQTGPVALTSLLTFGALSTLAEPGSDRYIALGLLLALVVGVVRLAIGLLRAGVIAYLMSQPMLMGFVPAAAVLIVASQLPAALAADPPSGGLLEQAAWSLTHPGSWEPASVAASLGVLAVVLAGRRLHPLFPGVLLAAVVAIVISSATGYRGPTVGEVAVSAPPLTLDLPWGQLASLLVPGAVIGIVGFAEAASIGRAFAAQDRERWDSDREFVSQGAANVAAGLTGGFPVGGSFSRSSLNRLAGASSPWSGVVTGLVVLAALPLAFLLEPLPSAVLGAIVIAAALPLLRPDRILRLWRPSKPGFLIAAGTFVATLAVAPRVERGVLVGIALSLLVHLLRELRIDARVWTEGTELHVRPQGVLWFGAAQGLQDAVVAELAVHRDAERLVLHLDGLGRLDITGAIALRAIIDEGRRSGVKCELEGVQPRDRRLVDRAVRAPRSLAD